MTSHKPVPGYEHYQVSDAGVFTNTRTGKTLRAHPTPKGYLTVSLYTGGVGRTLYVHRVVAEAFIGPANGLCVNHKDGNKANNSAANLEWVTVLENNLHAIQSGLTPASQETLDILSDKGASSATFLCESCGEPFVGRHIHRRKGWARYCSNQCRAIGVRRTNDKQRQASECTKPNGNREGEQ